MVKKPLLFLLLLSSATLSSFSFGEWTKVIENTDGDELYVDYSRIRIIDKEVFYWQMTNLLKPDVLAENAEVYSFSNYRQVDCSLFRFKVLSIGLYKGRMAQEPLLHQDPQRTYWEYPHPKTMNEVATKEICDYASRRDSSN